MSCGGKIFLNSDVVLGHTFDLSTHHSREYSIVGGQPGWMLSKIATTPKCLDITHVHVSSFKIRQKRLIQSDVM